MYPVSGVSGKQEVFVRLTPPVASCFGAQLPALVLTMQTVGRQDQALAALGEALEKWDDVATKRDEAVSDEKHEIFFDRGVLR